MGALRNLTRILRGRVNQWLGRDLPHRLDLRCDSRVQLGVDGCDWTVCPDRIGPGSVVYCVGVGFDASFDLAMIERFGLEVHAFDPTPRCLEWVRDQDLPDAWRFHEYGLAAEDGELNLYTPAKDAHVSFMSMPTSPDAEALAMPVRKLSTIMDELGHDRVDVLKMDIEGAEYDVIEDIAASGVEVGQLLVEFHHGMGGVPLARTRQAVETIRSMGMKAFYIAPLGREYSFLKP